MSVTVAAENCESDPGGTMKRVSSQRCMTDSHRQTDRLTNSQVKSVTDRFGYEKRVECVCSAVAVSQHKRAAVSVTVDMWALWQGLKGLTVNVRPQPSSACHIGGPHVVRRKEKTK